jgi:hypothetical protein
MEGLWSIVLNVRCRLPVYGIAVFVGDHIFRRRPVFILDWDLCNPGWED